ncbi:hypothetical protein Scep_009113 [Stephania cephalantha]|uniref:Uncharacterized protein n=1 Tax=Stephania cephalantha TaxID=152367 RepID=A0AAP0PCT5_9MAGN
MRATDEEVEGLVGQTDLLVVGPGVLGRLVAAQWRKEHPGCQVFGQTVTADHHDELIKLGISPSLKGGRLAGQVPYVIFCAPPSRTADYAGDVSIELEWEGSFLFTSSSAPYDCFDNGPCDEDSPIVPIGRSPRTDVLLSAEKVVLEVGGCVLRLAGLYISSLYLDRGAHAYWLKKGTVEARPDHVLNLIHYECGSDEDKFDVKKLMVLAVIVLLLMYLRLPQRCRNVVAVYHCCPRRVSKQSISSGAVKTSFRYKAFSGQLGLIWENNTALFDPLNKKA